MIWKITRKILLIPEILLLLLLSYVTYGLIGMLIPVNSNYEYQSDEYAFYVISNGVHTDICLPAHSEFMDWTQWISAKDFKGIYSQPKYISIGWGDKGFYLDTPTWSDLKLSTAVNAVLLPSPTAMHVTYLQAEPKSSNKVVKCSMNEQEYRALVAFVKSSFDLSDQGKNVRLIKDKGYTDWDNFYEAQGSYSGWRTCNSWTNEALKIAGVKTSYHALFESGIMRWFH